MVKKIIIAIFLVGLISYILISKGSKTELVTPQFAPQESAPLKEVMGAALKDTQGTWGIVIKNLKTGESYLQNGYTVFEAASLYKLWVMATVFNQIEKGKLSEEEVVKGDVAKLNEKFNIASESAELLEGEFSFSVKSALQQMITISHNYAALLLTERVKSSEVANFLKNHKLNDSSFASPPKTTALEVAVFLEKLYKGELGNEENTQKMLDLMKAQQLNEGLPKFLPDVTIAHKTGDLGWFKHDAGIVFSDSGPFIIVVMSESNSPKGAQEKIAKIAKAVYEYFR